MNKARTQKQSGYIMIFNALLFISVSILILVAVSDAVLSNYSATRSALYARLSYNTASSALEEALYRLKSGKPLGATTNLSLLPGQASIILANTSNGKKVSVNASVNNHYRKLQVELVSGAGVSFYYGIQSGEGGFRMANTSSVIGNVFSNGPVTGSGNLIRGDVISGGSSGLVDGVHATGTVYAHTIGEDSGPTTIDKDAYYQVLDSGVTVTGTKHPNSPDIPLSEFPISDEQIDEWETMAEGAGGTVNCTNGTYTISTSATIGPLKIPCNFHIQGATVTVQGHIWVTGNIEISQASVLKMDPELGNTSIAVIADKKTASTTSSLINVGQSVSFQNTGTPGSFIFLISQNGDSENGGTTNAISMNNGFTGAVAVAYAPHGQIFLGQSANVKEVTAYKIITRNSATVKYDQGLPHVLFQSGPGGGYDTISWQEL